MSLVDPANAEVSVERQCRLPRIPRSSHHHKPKGRRRSPGGEERERAARVVDEARLEMPCAGAREARAEPRERTAGAVDVSRRCVAGLMEEMNVRPVYPRPSISKPAKKAPKHPYLLKNKAIRFPNQVRGVDITYIPIGRAHMHLTCVVDWHGRYVVGRGLADDMGAAGVCACVEAAFAEHGAPSILNSGQGSVFNLAAYEGLLAGRHVLQSMGGKARRVDNVVVERWFRSLKSECLRAGEHKTPAEPRRLVAAYVDQHNSARRHQSLGYETPAEWCHSGLMAA